MTSVQNQFGFSEALSGHFRGRKLIEHKRPIVKNERQELFSTTESPNIVFGGRLGDKKRRKPTTKKNVTF